jgi:hypothetical protein
VGYDDSREVFKIMNSWGNNWCHNGFCLVSYDMMRQIAPEPGAFCHAAFVMDNGTAPTQPNRDRRETPRTVENVKLVQSNSFRGAADGRSYHEITIRLDGSLTALAQVDRVTYHFSSPVDRRSRENGFAVTIQALGEYRVRATAHLRDGTDLSLELQLQLRDEGPSELTLTNNAQPYARDRDGTVFYHWTAYVKGPASQLREIQSVRYYLHETFSPSVREVSTGMEDGFPLSTGGWGTFMLRARVNFKDGSARELRHYLQLSKTDQDESTEPTKRQRPDIQRDEDFGKRRPPVTPPPGPTDDDDDELIPQGPPERSNGPYFPRSTPIPPPNWDRERPEFPVPPSPRKDG